VTAPAQRIRLVEVLPQVHQDLDAESRARVERLTLPLVELDKGPCDLAASRHPGAIGPPFGSIVASGLLVRNVAIGDRVSTHLYGPQDLIGLDEPADGSLPRGVELAALERSQLMLLDDRFLAVAQRWPRLMSRVLRTSATQLARSSDVLAIAQLPRVEERLLAMFWSLADRWGERRGDEVAVRLAVSHGTLGRLIGARRPTGSLGLRNLEEAGRLHREGDDWLLPADSLDGFGDAVSARRVSGPRMQIEVDGTAAAPERSAR
jgi:CRP/FNR family transcriptional regulator, cyclic AMP receptor protein